MKMKNIITLRDYIQQAENRTVWNANRLSTCLTAIIRKFCISFVWQQEDAAAGGFFMKRSWSVF